MLKRFLLTSIILAASFIVCAENVIAIGSEGGIGGYGRDCNIYSSATFICAFGENGIGGASWRWYEWPEGEDSVEIPGYVNDAVGGVNIYGDTITGCGKVGGYWRYAYVATQNSDRQHYVRYKDGTPGGFKEKDQVGLFYIGGDNNLYRSNQFVLNGVRGAMYYNTFATKAAPWEKVEKIYKAAQANNPDIFTKGWNGTSTLSWFCASSPENSTFEGESAVMETDNSSVDHHTISDSDKKFTGWAKASNTSRKATYTFTCNDKCSLSFRHYLKRTSDSLGSTQYRIYRSYNGDDPKSYTVAKNKTDKNFTASYKSERVDSSDILTIEPGQTICEAMVFSLEGSPNGTLGSNNGTTTICATATAPPTIEPDTETSNTSLDMKVKNNSSANGYKSYVYAKPTDTVEFLASYNPAPQQYYRYFNDSSITISGITKKGWNNAFTITTDNFKVNSTNRINHIYSAGGIESKAETNTYRISTSPLFNINSVGKILTETAMTNPLNDDGDETNLEVWSTPTTITKKGNNITATAGQLTSSASVIVPYNFSNSAELINQESETIVYAGESSSISYTIKVNPQKGKFVNQENGYDVEGNQYATIVRGGKVKVCTGNDVANCGNEGIGEIVKTDATWNAWSDPDGWSNPKNSASISIPDVPAGTQMCVAVAVYPANSDDGAYNLDPEGNRQWAVSNKQCYTVAKKPSFQVWGGDIYSAGEIKLDVAQKTNLSGYTLGENKMRVFGSWGELAVISEGRASGLASGAGLGYASNNNGTLSPNPFNGHYNTASDSPSPGGLEVSTSTPYLCKVSYLTFANTDCSSGATDGLSGSQNGGSAEEVKLPDGLITDSDRNTDIFEVGKIINLADPDSVKTTSNDIRYYHYASSSGGLEISNKNSNYKIPKNTVVVIESADNIFIKDNIFYDSTGYGSLEEIPKVIIYSEKNILIDYGIENIDAVLIAKGNINTCSTYNSDAAISHTKSVFSECSHQLRINGAVIAGGKLLLNRTYGAATGANSIVPAEIINYDPSLYSWNLSSRSPDSNTPSTWEQVYTSELAPRY